MTTLLVTGFGPFPGAPYNPTGPLKSSTEGASRKTSSRGRQSRDARHRPCDGCLSAKSSSFAQGPSAFAKAASGALSDEQIDAIVGGLRSRGTSVGSTGDLNPPPYATSASGDLTRGGDAFATFWSKCHGDDGHGGPGASSIVDPAYLSLVSDQSLRTTVIAGRPDLGAPDWRGNVPGRPMSDQEVSDVVAWLAAGRMP